MVKVPGALAPDAFSPKCDGTTNGPRPGLAEEERPSLEGQGCILGDGPCTKQATCNKVGCQGVPLMMRLRKQPLERETTNLL